MQRAYDAVLVASNSMKNCYIKQYGFDEEKVFVTGYARTDRLVRGNYNRNEIYRQSRLEGRGDQAYVMIAPTWSHSEYGGSDIPFNLNTAEFFGILSEVAEAEKIHFIFRSHLNSANVVNNHPKHISILSVNDYPQTEELLYISSVLVSDWSSIVFDYLVLDRPTIFIDKPDPFPKGFSYGPEYRFGDISHNVDDLLQSISFAVNHPEDYLSAHEKNMKRVRSEVYGSYADGKSASRAVKQILKIT